MVTNPNSIIADNPVYSEPHYRDGRTSETERLVPTTRLDTPIRTLRPLRGVAILIGALLLYGVLWRLILAAAIFKAGYLVGRAATAAQPYVTERGWIAVLIACLLVPIFLIYRDNRIRNAFSARRDV